MLLHCLGIMIYLSFQLIDVSECQALDMVFCVQVILRKAISVLSALTYNTRLLQFPLIPFTFVGKIF